MWLHKNTIVISLRRSMCTLMRYGIRWRKICPQSGDGENVQHPDVKNVHNMRWKTYGIRVVKNIRLDLDRIRRVMKNARKTVRSDLDQSDEKTQNIRPDPDQIRRVMKNIRKTVQRGMSSGTVKDLCNFRVFLGCLIGRSMMIAPSGSGWSLYKCRTKNFTY